MSDKTCKECEYYEDYSGTRHRSATWRCINKVVVENSSYDGYYNIEPSICTHFTPKKPAEKEVKRKCEACRFSSYNNNGRLCIDHPDRPKGICGWPSLAYWQPIEKEAERPKKKCIGEDCYWYDAPEALKYSACKKCQPIEKPAEKEAERCCKACKHSYRNNDTGVTCIRLCGGDYSGWQPIEKPAQATMSPKEITDWADLGRPISDRLCKETPEFLKPKKAKENKMLAKFTIRRYVMLCTVIVTTQIAIWLNPKLFWLLGLLGATADEGKPINSKDPMQIAMAWILLIVTCVIICAAIYAFNKATAWIFGEKK